MTLDKPDLLLVLVTWGGMASAQSVFRNTQTDNLVFDTFTKVKYNVSRGMNVGHKRSKQQGTTDD